MSNHKQFARALGLCVPLALAFASAAGAATIDFTTLSTDYFNGTSSVAVVPPVMPPGWAEIKDTNLLSVSTAGSTGTVDNFIPSLGNDSQFVASVQTTTSSTNHPGTFASFLLNTGVGVDYVAIDIGTASLAVDYGSDNSPAVYQLVPGYTGGALTLKFVRSGSTVSAYYSTDGLTFTQLYTQFGVSGDSLLDLQTFGGTAGETVNFTNLTVTDTTAAAPEPASLWLSAPFGLALAWFEFRKRARS